MRSKIEANEYKDYILGFIFYKYLFETEERFMHRQGASGDEMAKYLKESDHDAVSYLQSTLGYFIEHQNLFSTWITSGSDFDISNVRDALSAFSRNVAENYKKVFSGIFHTLETGLSKLGDNAAKQTKSARDLIYLINEIPMDSKSDYAVLGFIYEYLISNFAASASKNQKEFIKLWGSILRLVNILSAFDEFNDAERLDSRSEQDYQSIYLELYHQFREQSQGDKESIADDVVFEIELAKQVEVNVDYILMRVAEALERNGGTLDKTIRADITRSINASPTLHKKRDLIEAFLAHINVANLGGDAKVDDEWHAFIQENFAKELKAIIEDEKLKPELTTNLVANVLKDGADIPTDGTAISKLLPPISRFRKDNQRGQKRQEVVARLQAFIERFRGLGGE